MSSLAAWEPLDSQADEFEHYYVPRLSGPFGQELVALVAPRQGERALDVACGTGAVTRILAGQVGPAGRVVGVDVNPEMLGVARRAVPSPMVEWREASATALPLADCTFDLVTCQQGLQFFPDRPAALREMRRVLVPGGRLALACWRSPEHNPGALASEQALARAVGPEAAVMPQFVLGDREEVRRLVRGAGFADVTIRVSIRIVRHPSAEEYARHDVVRARSRIGALREMDDAVLQAIADDVTKSLQPYEDDLGLAVPMATHIVTARA